MENMYAHECIWMQDDDDMNRVCMAVRCLLLSFWENKSIDDEEDARIETDWDRS